MKALRKRLGELLYENGLITKEQLEEALDVHKETGERLGKTLMELGYVTEEDIINVLELQLGITKVDLQNKDLKTETVRIVPENLARRYQVIAIDKKDDRLTVAMVDPLNVMAFDDLRLATKCEIIPVIAREKEIQHAIGKFYGFSQLKDSEGEARDEIAAAVLESGETYELEEPSRDGGSPPVVRLVNSIIHQAVQLGASDIHIEPQEKNIRVRYRVDGLLREITMLSKSYHPPLVSRIKIMAEMSISEKRLPQDGRIQIRMNKKEVDLRISTLPAVHGEKVVIRVLDKGRMFYKLEELGFQKKNLEAYRKLIKRPYGMVLITGPTGSGKTTTLYATLNEINTPEKNIVTIEDPVEYVLSGINQLPVNPKAGLHFASGLRSIVRQDPDIIMVGEIRDLDTASIAIRAAITGHLVFSTLHTNDAVGTISRLVDMGAEPFMVASSITGVVAQRLVRKICSCCKVPCEVPEKAEERIFLNVPSHKPLTIYFGKGCPECNYTGYRGRQAISEVYYMSAAQRELVVNKASDDELKEKALEEGMVTLRADGINKVLEGLTTIEEIKRVTYSAEDEGL